jgi:hypothetical protein
VGLCQVMWVLVSYLWGMAVGLQRVINECCVEDEQVLVWSSSSEDENSDVESDYETIPLPITLEVVNSISRNYHAL